MPKVKAKGLTARIVHPDMEASEVISNRVLCGYFTTMGTHGDYKRYGNDCAIFYTFNIEKIVGTLTNCVDTVVVNRPPSFKTQSFYDDGPSDLSRVDSVFKDKRTVIIKVMDTKEELHTVGVIDIDRNILLGTDWPHRDYNVDLASIIMRELEARKYVSVLKESKIKITLGADPEFEELKTPEEYSPVQSTLAASTREKIGRDGCGAQIEIRPDPATTPAMLLKNIQRLIRDCPPMSTRGDRYPLGAHIHIGGILPTTDVIEMLDAFLGKVVKGSSGEARGSYNVLSAVRSQPHGFEYRTPPSSWLDNPRIAYITLKLVHELCLRAASDEGFTYEVGSKGIPLRTTYLNILPKHDVDYFFKFFEKYTPVSYINANWVKRPKLNKCVITFEGEWNPHFQEHLSTRLHRYIKSGKIVFSNKLGKIGDVVGITISDFKCVTLESVAPELAEDKDTFYVGLPYSIRNYKDSGYLDRVADAIKNQMGKRI